MQMIPRPDFRNLLWVPLITGLLMPITFLITYVWSVMLDHVEPDFPYISATGTTPPESCFFALMLHIIGFLLAVTVWIRHKQILDYCNQTVASRNLPRRSRISSFLGYVASFGMCLVGAFQATNVKSVHLIGAALAFGVGNAYLWTQGCLSLNTVPRLNSKDMAVLRLVLSAVATIMIIISVLFSFLHSAANEHVAYWSQSNEWRLECGRRRWAYHLVATSTEWILAGAFIVFLFTLVPEFKRISYEGTVLTHERDRRQVRETNIVQATETIQSQRL